MTTPTTDSEWQTLLTTLTTPVESSLSQPSKSYPSPPSIPSTIDHTLLALSATPSQIDTLCTEALTHNFATVCVRPNFVSRCVKNLEGSGVGVAAVVGFHEGTYTTEEKLRDLKESLEGGAREGDIVINWRELITGSYHKIYEELVMLRKAAPPPTLLKLILETSQLTSKQILAGALLAHAAGLDYIKTATGFHGHGATVEHVRLMKVACEVLGKNLVVERKGGEMKVKASGGVRSLEDARRMIEVGAGRLGTSAGAVIAEQCKGEGSAEGGGGQEGEY